MEIPDVAQKFGDFSIMEVEEQAVIDRRKKTVEHRITNLSFTR